MDARPVIDETEMKLQYVSIPEDDNLVCEVYYRDKFLCELHIVPNSDAPEDFSVQIEFIEQDCFVGSLPLDSFLQLLSLAKERYVTRMIHGPNPFEAPLP